ncbi:MAG: vWA domain-containing protein, partial [Anaerolineae bacterium]
MPDADRRHILNGFWALVVFCGLTALLLHAVNVEAQGPVQHDIILLLDNSGSMVRPYRITAAGTQTVIPYDADQRRIRFSRFLIRLLQNSPADGTAVGAAIFAAEVKGARPMSSTVVLAPLTDLSAWTAADVTAIQQQPCPPADAKGSDGKPVAQQAGRDFCYGTRYAAVFEWAAQQLQRPVACGSPTRRCDILIFTDGALQEPNSDTAAVVVQSLRRLASQGIKVSVILFSSPKTDPANVKEWREWQASGILEKVTTYARDLPIRQLYEQGLDSLGLTALLNGYTPVELPQETIVLADQLPLNTTNLRLNLITDSPITDTYSVSPNLVAGQVRWWSAPSFVTLTGALEGSGLLYYRAVSETTPVVASVTLLPEIQQVSKTVGIQVFVGVGFRSLDDSYVHVTGLVEPVGITAPLHYGGAAWRGELPSLRSGQYTVTALIEPSNRVIVGELEIRAQALQIIPRPRPTARLRVIPAAVFAGRPFEIDASLLLEDMSTDLMPGS